jgi:3-oxoacyl-[acyl-carrier-protein] synthase II
MEGAVLAFADSGPSRMNPFLVPMVMANATPALLAMRLGWCGPNYSVSSACASGAHAVGEGARLIRDGTADVVLCGGTESLITPTAISAFARMGALSTRNDKPPSASRPFDRDRDGFVMGEGAGFVVLESWQSALDRNAHIHGELVGYGRNVDAHHITAPSPGGAGAAACMQMALDDASLSPSAIGHINAHGTSTPLNDLHEAHAIAKVFGHDAPPVTSTKGAMGHLIGAAGSVEVVATVLAVGAGTVPPIANHHHPDESSELDFVCTVPRSVPAEAAALSNSFGFGGHNVSLILAPAL